MAKNALSKEVRSIVSHKTGKVRRRMAEANTIDKMTVSASTGVGTTLCAVLDGYGKRIPLGQNHSMSTGIVGGVLGLGIGLLMKGHVGAGFLGFGIGQFNGVLYGTVRDKIEEHESAKAHDEEG